MYRKNLRNQQEKLKQAKKDGKPTPKIRPVQFDRITFGEIQNPTCYGLLEIIAHYLDLNCIPYVSPKCTTAISWQSWFPSLTFDAQFDVLSLFNGRPEYQYRVVDSRQLARRFMGQNDAMKKLNAFAGDIHRYVEQLPLTFDHYQRLIEMVTIMMAPFLGSSYGQIPSRAGIIDQHFETARHINSLRNRFTYDITYNLCVVRALLLTRSYVKESFSR